MGSGSSAACRACRPGTRSPETLSSCHLADVAGYQPDVGSVGQRPTLAQVLPHLLTSVCRVT